MKHFRFGKSGLQPLRVFLDPYNDWKLIEARLLVLFYYRNRSYAVHQYFIQSLEIIHTSRNINKITEKKWSSAVKYLLAKDCVIFVSEEKIVSPK